MSKIIRLFVTLSSCLSLFALLWPLTQAVEARPLHACQNNITVTSTADSGPGSLRQALVDLCDDGTITFAASLANQTITLTSAELSIDKNVTITNPNAPKLRISGNHSYRVFNILTDTLASVSNLQIAEGMSLGGSGCDYCGGGIFVSPEAHAALNNITFDSNLAGHADYQVGLGGGIYNLQGTVTINKGSFIGNAAGNNGGAIYNNRGIMTINQVNFTNNTSGQGGTIFQFRGVLNISQSLFQNNSAQDGSSGGAISIGLAEANITETTFISNSARTGGAIYNNRGTLTIERSAFISNSASYGGGAILNSNISGPSTLIVRSTLFSGNSATSYGGGISTSGETSLYNSTFSNNSAARGGGIKKYFWGTLTIENSTLSHNLATDMGGNLQTEGSGVYLRNNIIANSTGGGDCFRTNAYPININNLIEDGSCDPTFSGDPLLGPLQDNGGSTATHALLPGSPAIDAGDPATCLTVDQRGIARPQLGQCDIGAFESQGFDLAIKSGNNQAAQFDTPFWVPLAVQVTGRDQNEPVDGGFITFTAPSNGPSTTFAPTTTVTITNGIASLAVTANAEVGGPYAVTAGAWGGNELTFNLTNTLDPVPAPISPLYLPLVIK